MSGLTQEEMRAVLDEQRPAYRLANIEQVITRHVREALNAEPTREWAETFLAYWCRPYFGDDSSFDAIAAVVRAATTANRAHQP